MSQKHTVICSAGHIDHGKSSLIEKLTGYHPDVLQEERDREMTIELGFAFYGDEVTFIDVPGHEKFLKTMLAGASGVDGAILVIAADDGIMPQTMEHFQVLKFMGIKEGIIALTKIDLVEEEWIELVKEEIQELCKGSFLENAPIIEVSNRTGKGIDLFREKLTELISRVPRRKDRGLFRMWLDRAFTIKGAGTIVAGTVLSGQAKINDHVEILPEKKEARIKRIQVHKTDVDHCKIGDRAALNLPGIDKETVHRGDLLATPDHYRPSFMLNARLIALPQNNKAIENRLRIRLHLGSSELIGRIVLLEDCPVGPGDQALVQFRLESQAMADVGDRFVVRSFSEGRVIAGGKILEVHPRKQRRINEGEKQRLNRLESAEPHEIIRQYLMKLDTLYADAETISHETSFLKSHVIDILSAMRRDDEIVVIDKDPKWGVVLSSRYDDIQKDIIDYVRNFHAKNKNLTGVRRSDIKSRLLPRVGQNVFEFLLRDIEKAGEINLAGEIVSHRDFKISLTGEQEEIKNALDALFQENRFSPPNLSEIPSLVNSTEKEIKPILTAMIELGILIQLFTPEGKPIYYHKNAIDEARRLLLEFYETHDELKFFEFRELIGSSRKFTTPLLNLFDDEGLVIRDGEVRRLRK